VYGRNSDKGGDLTDVGASAIGRVINKEINLMDAGCRPLHYYTTTTTTATSTTNGCSSYCCGCYSGCDSSCSSSEQG